MKKFPIFSLFISVMLLFSCSSTRLTAQSEINDTTIDTLWQKEFCTAREIIENYCRIKETAGNNAAIQLKNQCNFIWQSGEYMFRCKGKNADIKELAQYSEEIELDNGIIEEFMIERDTARFVDHYFTLRNMKRGDSFEDSRDGITITVFYHPRKMNCNDYAKLKEVFSCNNEALHIAYMKKLKFPFRNSGCDEEFYAIRPYIEKNVKESKLKSEIIALFDLYRNIMPGEKAPTPVLKDINGNEHTFAEFKGKILVIDVWATWCSSCLKGFEAYKQLSEKYKEQPDIAFITVSVDRKDAFESVKAVIERRGLKGLLNLVTDCEAESQFESDYHISGIPRYIIIDKEGKIVTAYAPSANTGMEEMINNLLDQ